MSYRTEQGVWVTKGLFHPLSVTPEWLKYTLDFEDREYHGQMLPGFYRLYLELEDPTGYKAANELFGGMEHWEALKKCKALAPYFAQLNEWLELKIRSRAFANVLSESYDGNFQASKYLLEKNWLPSKEGAKEDKKRTVEQGKIIRGVFDEDLARLGL